MTNWNESSPTASAPRTRIRAYGSVMRVDLLDENLERLRATTTSGRWPRSLRR